METNNESKFLTIPNIVTALRFLGIPVFIWLLFGLDNRLAAAILLGSLGATDWIDGYLARKLNQESAIGRIIDPTVDRLLILVAIPALLIDESVPFAFGIVSLVREGVVGIVALVLLAINLDSIKVNWFGKAGTFGLFWAYPFFLLSVANVPSGLEEAARISAWVTGIGGLICGYIALILYIPAVIKGISRKST